MPRGVVVPDPPPVHRGPGKGLLHGVLGLGQAPGDGIYLDDEAPVVAGVELLELPLSHAPPKAPGVRFQHDTTPAPPGFPAEPTVIWL
jgi:hypothetical protein